MDSVSTRSTNNNPSDQPASDRGVEKDSPGPSTRETFISFAHRQEDKPVQAAKRRPRVTWSCFENNIFKECVSNNQNIWESDLRDLISSKFPDLKYIRCVSHLRTLRKKGEITQVNTLSSLAMKFDKSKSRSSIIQKERKVGSMDKPKSSDEI